MRLSHRSLRQGAGFSLIELLAVVCGIGILATIGIPLLSSVTETYSLTLAAQHISTQLQAARMKAVSDNDTIRVRFNPGAGTYQLETGDGTRLAGPFAFSYGTAFNTADTGSAISFPGQYVEFQPNGTLPLSGNGSTGRVKIKNNADYRMDILVNPAGMVRITPTFKTASPPF
jgi:Tfp pilus assembly protein FimT